MNRRGRDERKEEFGKFLKDSALAATSAVNLLTNFPYDKWFVRLKSENYLSKFMSWFNKKMNEQDFNNEEITEKSIAEEFSGDGEIFDMEGENINSAGEQPKQKVKSMRENELENKLKEETARREAAEAKLVGVQAKFEEIKTQMERDTQEMRARMQKTLEDRAKQGQFSFLTTLLPVLDNLNLAIAASEKDSSFEHLLSGVKGTARSFEQALMSVGVEAVPSIGAEFKPEIHEAIDMKEVSNEQEDGRITAEYSRGYRFGERLLRPARVQVGKAIKQQATAE
jgi:molecular chaperone GrpE